MFWEGKRGERGGGLCCFVRGGHKWIEKMDIVMLQEKNQVVGKGGWEELEGEWGNI